jgi:hypothetical protein
MNLVFRSEHDISETGFYSFLKYKPIMKDLLSWIRESELVSIAGHILLEDDVDRISQKFCFRLSKKFTKPSNRVINFNLSSL